jgi:hypothetical protein
MSIAYLKVALFKIYVEMLEGFYYYPYSLSCMGNDSDIKRIEKIETDSRFVEWLSEEEIKNLMEI